LEPLLADVILDRVMELATESDAESLIAARLDARTQISAD
jgi:hypothetical protein